MNSKLKIFICFFILFIIYASSLNNNLGTTGDNASYMVFSHSLEQGKWLSFLYKPGEPLSGYNVFVYPFLILIIRKIIGFDSVLILKFLSVIFTLLSIYFFIKLFNNIKEKIILIFLIGLNPLLFYFSHQILTESIFLFLSFLYFYLILSFEKDTKILYIFKIILIILAGFLLPYTRELGYLAIFSAGGYFLFNKKYKYISLPVVSVILILLFKNLYIKNIIHAQNLYSSLFFMKNQYVPSAGAMSYFDFFKRAFIYIFHYSLKCLPDLFFYPLFASIKPFINKTVNPLFFIKALAGVITSIFLIYGFIKKFSLKNIFILYLILNIGILLIWQSALPRYLITILPIIMLLLYRFIKNFKFKKTLLSIFIIVSLIGISLDIYKEQVKGYSPEWKNYFLVANYAKKNINKNEIIMCRKPGLFYLNSGNQTIEYPFYDDTVHLQNQIEKYNIKYIVIDDFHIGINTAEKYLKPSLIKLKMQKKIIYKTDKPENILLEIEK